MEPPVSIRIWMNFDVIVHQGIKEISVKQVKCYFTFLPIYLYKFLLSWNIKEPLNFSSVNKFIHHGPS